GGGGGRGCGRRGERTGRGHVFRVRPPPAALDLPSRGTPCCGGEILLSAERDGGKRGRDPAVGASGGVGIGRDPAVGARGGGGGRVRGRDAAVGGRGAGRDVPTGCRRSGLPWWV